MSTRLNAKLIWILVLGLIILLLPNLLRTYDARIGQYTYFYERIIKTNNFNYDEFSYAGRDFTYDLGPIYFLSTLSKIFNLETLLNILPIILGLITILLFYLLLRKLNLEKNEIYLALIFLIISPILFYVFSSYTSFAIILPIILLTLYLFLQENKIYKYLSKLFLLLLGFFDYKALIAVLIFMLIYLIKEKKLKQFYSNLFIAFLSLIISYLPRIINYNITYSVKENYFKILFSDLGGRFGISIFLLFFIVFGLNHLWKSKYKYLHLYTAFLISILLTIYNKHFLIYSSFFLFYLASLGFNYLIKYKWESELIRKLTIALLIIGFLFSSYSSLIAIKNSQPNQEMLNALTDLKAIGSSKDIVFSHYNYGIFINSITDKKNFMDKNFAFSPNFNERYQDMQTIFYTRNADKTKELLDRYNIKYILITKEMKEGLVWNEKDEGLLFVIQTSSEFRRIINNDEVEIWRVR